MSTGAKNKILTWLVVLLLAANVVTIAFFWLNKKEQAVQHKGTPADFLIKELALDAKQQEQLQVLVKEHRRAAEQLRRKTRDAKEAFFELLGQQNITDSTKQAAAKMASASMVELDLLTLDHFQKVRALCRPDQQKKFDEIIQEVVRMMAQPRPPMGPMGPPPGGQGGERPPPPPGE